MSSPGDEQCCVRNTDVVLYSHLIQFCITYNFHQIPLFSVYQDIASLYYRNLENQREFSRLLKVRDSPNMANHPKHLEYCQHRLPLVGTTIYGWVINGTSNAKH